MDEELAMLTARWMRLFHEPPVLLDAELMRRLIAEAVIGTGSVDDGRQDIEAW